MKWYFGAALASAIVAVGGALAVRPNTDGHPERLSELDVLAQSGVSPRLGMDAELRAIDRDNVARFWRCAFGRGIDVGQLANPQQARRLIEAAYGTQQASYAEHLANICVPELTVALRELHALEGAAFRSDYVTSLSELTRATLVYSTRIRSRQPTLARDALILEHAEAWYGEVREPNGRGAYAGFLHCAVPGLDQVQNAEDLAAFFASACFRKNPITFMDHARNECAKLLVTDRESGEPSGTGRGRPVYEQMRRRLQDTRRMQVSSWMRCSQMARAQQRMQDAAELLTATEHYFRARPN